MAEKGGKDGRLRIGLEEGGCGCCFGRAEAFTVRCCCRNMVWKEMEVDSPKQLVEELRQLL